MREPTDESVQGVQSVRDVLIVEEDAGLGVRLATELSTEYRVRTAANSLEALRCLERWRVDAVLLDLDMHEVDGFAVLARATALTPRPEVVVLSASDRVAVAVKAMRLGARDCITKPCSPSQAMEALGCRPLAAAASR